MHGFHADLQQTLQAALEAARAQPAHPSRSFWAHRSNDDFPPPAIRSPDQYDGSDGLNIAYAQGDLPAKAQRALLRRWCEALPDMPAVRYVWFQSRISQELFEAACRMPRLEGLYVHGSSIHDIDPLQGPKGLKYVRIGNSPGIADITGLSRLAQLRWLELDNLDAISDLAPVKGLSQLEGFSFTGAEGRRHTVESLAPLSELSRLRWLHLGAIHVHDGSLRPLGSLKNLKWLGLGKFFSWQEFAWLSARLPNTECPWLKPGDDLGRLGIRCKLCGAGIVLLSGKGLGKVCPNCQATKWNDFTARFAAAVESSRQ